MADRVSIDDLKTAASWLEANDGLEGEAEACARVAAWLDLEIEAREAQALARKASRKLGRRVPTAMARRQVRMLAA